MIFVDALLSAARRHLSVLRTDAALIDAARLLREAGCDMVVVCNADGVLAGVITKTDIVAHISQCQGSSCTVAASIVMSGDAVVCQAADRIDVVWSLMKERGLKNIPVIDGEARPVGVLNARDALQALMQEVQNEESLLRDYVMCVGYH